MDPETGEIVPNRKTLVRDSPVVKSRYLCAIYDRVSENMHLTEALKLSFPDNWKKILSIAYYLVSTGEPLSFCKQWTEQHKTPYNQTMTDSLINDLLTSINPNGISLFFTLWKLRVQPVETFTASINFGGHRINLSEFSKDYMEISNDFDNSLKMTMYFSTKSNIPICYQLSDPITGRRIGDYDVSPNSFSRLSSFIDHTRGDNVDPSLVPYADSNITVRTYPNNDFVRNLVEKVGSTITNPENYWIIMGTPMFIESFMQHVSGKKYYVHIFFDPNQAVTDLSAFISAINMCRYELEMDSPVERHQQLYDEFLIVREDEKKNTVVELNSEAIMNHNKYLGYNVLISNFTGNASTAIVPFIQRSSVSKMFESIRNEYDSTAMNLFTETNYLSRVFLQFISLILRAGVLNVMNSKKLNRTMTFKEVVMEISNLRTVKIPGVKRPQNTFASDEQLRILRAFDVPIDDEK